MEFLEREYEGSQRPLLPKFEYAKEDNEKFFDDLEDTLATQEARRLKDEARVAMNEAAYKKTSEFNKTWDRWQENKDRLEALREGYIQSEQPKFVPDWNKIGVTTTWQLSSISLALLCIINGVWPICLVSLPLMASLNLKWLLDREGK